MFFDYRGIKIYYEERGDGAPLILLHGWGGSVASFAPVADNVQGERRIITLDFPGHGQSGEPNEPWSVTEYAEMLAALAKHTGVESADIVGHSFGGRVAIYTASHWPDLVKKLVLVDSAGIMPKRTFKYYYRTYKYKLGKKLAKIGFIDRLFNLSERAKNAGSEEYRALSDGMKKTFVRVVNQDLRPYLKDIKSETLLVWGSEDTATPLWQAKIMESEIHDAGLVVFEGAGHFSYLDEFQRFMAVLNCFLGGAV